MRRIRIGKQTELSTVGGAVVLTDIATNEQKYLGQGATTEVLTENTVTGPDWELLGSDYKALWQIQPYQGVFVNEAVGVFNSANLYTETYTNTNLYPVLVELNAAFQINLIYAIPNGTPDSFDARIITTTTGVPNRWGGNLYQFCQIDDDGAVRPLGESLNRDYVQMGLSDCILAPGASVTFEAQLNINGGPGVFNTQARALYGSLTVTRLRSSITI